MVVVGFNIETSVEIALESHAVVTDHREKPLHHSLHFPQW